MVDGVHGNTTGLGPAVALDSELVLGARSLCRNLLENHVLPKTTQILHGEEKKTYS